MGIAATVAEGGNWGVVERYVRNQGKETQTILATPLLKYPLACNGVAYSADHKRANDVSEVSGFSISFSFLSG